MPWFVRSMGIGFLYACWWIDLSGQVLMKISLFNGSCSAVRAIGLAFIVVVCFIYGQAAQSQETAEPAASSVDYYLPLAKAGNVEAQYLLGLGYERGLAEAVDRRAAARWYRQAAEAGHAKAAYRLALLLLRGDSVVENHREASVFFGQAADADFPEAYYYLGYMHERGLGVAEDIEKALSSFESAADLGLVAGMKAAASLHVRRPAPNQNLVKAWYWLNKAAGSGDSDAEDMKGKLEGMMTKGMLDDARSLSGNSE